MATGYMAFPQVLIMMVEVCVFVKYFNDEVLDSTELKPDCLVGKEKKKKN